MPVDTQRLFFALWPDESPRDACSALRERLPAVSGQAVAAVNFHITLLFLGATVPGQRRCLEAAVSTLSLPPYTLTLDRCGYFRKSQVLWLGSTAVPSGLISLTEALRQAARRCEVSVETRPYHLHLSLYRKVSRAPPRPFALDRAVVWPVHAFALVESLSDAAGARYAVQRKWDLH